MKYRVMLALTFNTESEARELLQLAKVKVDRKIALKDDRVHVHKCYHDEDPPRPCEVIEEWRPYLSLLK